MSTTESTTAHREHDHLAVGDTLEEWAPRRRVDRPGIDWGWREGDVLAVVDKPCGGDGAPAWVALIQWHDGGGNVTRWTALPQHEWIGKGPSTLRRKVTQ